MISNATELNNHLNARNLLVAVKNKLLQNICHSLNTLQMTTLAYLISKIKPGDSYDTIYEIDLDELLALLRWTDMRYTSVRTAINALSKAEWWIGGSKTSYHGFITYSEISYSSRLMDICFTDTISPYLFGLRLGSKENPMTIYPLEYILPMKSRYSIRLYELMKTHSNLTSWVYEYGTGSYLDIKPMLAQWQTVGDGKYKLPNSWNRWRYFEEKIMKPAVKEINTYTDLTIKYTAHFCDFKKRKTNVIRSIEFSIKVKTSDVKSKTKERLEKLYANYAAQWDVRFKDSNFVIEQIPKESPSTYTATDPVEKSIIATSQFTLLEPPLPPESVADASSYDDDNNTDDMFYGDDDELFADPTETEKEYRRLYLSNSKSTSGNNTTSSQAPRRKGERFGYDLSPQNQPHSNRVTACDDDVLPF